LLSQGHPRANFFPNWGIRSLMVFGAEPAIRAPPEIILNIPAAAAHVALALIAKNAAIFFVVASHGTSSAEGAQQLAHHHRRGQCFDEMDHHHEMDHHRDTENTEKP